jgi:hypothetical protein
VLGKACFNGKPNRSPDVQLVRSGPLPSHLRLEQQTYGEYEQVKENSLPRLLDGPRTSRLSCRWMILPSLCNYSCRMRTTDLCVRIWVVVVISFPGTICFGYDLLWQCCTGRIHVFRQHLPLAMQMAHVILASYFSLPIHASVASTPRSYSWSQVFFTRCTQLRRRRSKRNLHKERVAKSIALKAEEQPMMLATSTTLKQRPSVLQTGQSKVQV